jgi:16S rRNA (guanine527-N7)-methyltransferase
VPAQSVLTAYADLLAGAGVERGLIGPREVPRLWGRHLLNCAVVVDPESGLVPEGTSVIDVGSGAGLPGLVWAIARPDLDVVLLEPLLRRATFLEEAVASLGLERVQVVRGRAEECRLTAAVVTARAVAPLERLLTWVAPLVAPGGEVLALKGSSAAEEIVAAQVAGIAGTFELIECGAGVVAPPTTVVRIRELQRPRSTKR